MLSVKRCRELLGFESGCLSDREIETLREQLYNLASLSVTRFVETQRHSKLQSNVLDFKTALSSFIDGEIDCIEERAAIIEFDGKLPRDESERAAIAMTLRGSATREDFDARCSYLLQGIHSRTSAESELVYSAGGLRQVL